MDSTVIVPADAYVVHARVEDKKGLHGRVALGIFSRVYDHQAAGGGVVAMKYRATQVHADSPCLLMLCGVPHGSDVSFHIERRGDYVALGEALRSAAQASFH